MRDEHEKTSATGLQSKARSHARVPQTYAHQGRAEDPGSSSKERALAAHPVVALKSDRAFRDVYRRGRWARGVLLSVGAAAGGTQTRIGLRTKRGLRGAVVRNRLKRQLRAIVSTSDLSIFHGADLVIVAHPDRGVATTAALAQEFAQLCGRLARAYRVASRSASS